MPRYLHLIFAFLFVMFGAATATAADVKLGDGTMLSAKPFYIVTYIEVDPGAAAKARKLIKKHGTDSKKDAGNLRYETLQRTGRKNHFIILEAWSDQDARDAHAKAGHTLAFRKALQPLLYSPFDERAHVGLIAGDPKKEPKPGKGAVYVLTHVDIIPPEQFAPCKRQVKESGPCGNDLVAQLVAAGRKGDGNLRFDALTQANRPNHMEVVEVWKSSADQHKHTVSKAVKDFRDELSGIPPGSGVASDPTVLLNPLTGSLYDERLYKSID
jgi:quinol monooxygenase YgiN